MSSSSQELHLTPNHPLGYIEAASRAVAVGSAQWGLVLGEGHNRMVRVLHSFMVVFSSVCARMAHTTDILTHIWLVSGASSHAVLSV